MNPWTQRAVAIFFMVQMAFQTILSSTISEETRWNLYWIFFGMASVLLFDFLVSGLRPKSIS